MSTDKQRSYLYGLVVNHKEFQQKMGAGLWEAGDKEVMNFLHDKWPDSVPTLDIESLTSAEASVLISNMKNL